jgi:hypothetical protein
VNTTLENEVAWIEWSLRAGVLDNPRNRKDFGMVNAAFKETIEITPKHGEAYITRGRAYG